MGSGFKTFTAGSVLTASDVQNYLQDQAVMVFAGTAARSSAIGTANFEEGMLTYLTDVDKLQVYTGSSFEDVYPPAASNQGLTLLNTTSFSGVSSISVPTGTFTATYDNYFAVFQASFATAANITLRLRAAGSDLSSALYRYAAHYVATNADHLLDTGNTQTSGRIVSNNINRHTAQITFFNPFLTANTQFDVQAGGGRDATVFASAQYGTNEYNATTSVDAFTLIFSQSGTGTVSVYGFNK